MNDICILNFQDMNIVKDLIRFFDNDSVDVQKNEIINIKMQLKEMENKIEKNFEEVKQIQNAQSEKMLMTDEDLTDIKKNTNNIEDKVDDLKQKMLLIHFSLK